MPQGAHIASKAIRFVLRVRAFRHTVEILPPALFSTPNKHISPLWRTTQQPGSYRRMRFAIPFLLAAAAFAPAQIVSFGVKAGVPFSEARPRGPVVGGGVNTDRWTVGPSVEFRLPGPLWLEIDALYRGYSADRSYSFTDPDYGMLFASNREETRVWDVPVQLKYRFSAGRLRPFVSGGISASINSSDINMVLTCYEGGAACAASRRYAGLGQTQAFEDTRILLGPVAGAGLEFRFGQFVLAPEVRYYRTPSPAMSHVTALLGFRF